MQSSKTQISINQYQTILKRGKIISSKTVFKILAFQISNCDLSEHFNTCSWILWLKGNDKFFTISLYETNLKDKNTCAFLFFLFFFQISS